MSDEAYRIWFVDDDELPEGHDWAMIECPGMVVCVFKRSRLTPRVLEEAWAAYRHLAAHPVAREPLPV